MRHSLNARQHIYRVHKQNEKISFRSDCFRFNSIDLWGKVTTRAHKMFSFSCCDIEDCVVRIIAHDEQQSFPSILKHVVRNWLENRVYYGKLNLI